MLARRESPEYQLMLRALGAGPMCARDLAIELGITTRNARLYFDEAKGSDVTIVAWDKGSRGPWYPIFALRVGDTPDVPSPPQKTIAARRRAAVEQKQRSRQDVIYWLNELAQKRALRGSRREQARMNAKVSRGETPPEEADHGSTSARPLG